MKKNYNILFILFILSLSLFSLSFFQIDPDYLWHIKAGELMVQKGILWQDIFSWSVASSYWFSHEWLFEVVIYCLKNIFGKYHLFIYCFSCITSINLLIYFYNKENIKKNTLFSIIWVILSLIISVQVQARPHMIQFLFFTLLIYLCMDNYKNDSKKIYFLPLIGILWANFHGGSSNLIYIIPLLFYIGGHFEFQFKKIEANKISFIQLKRFLFVSILCVISICINIHGFKMLYYPYMNMMNTTMLSNISEWRSTTLSDPVHYIYFGLLVIGILILLFSKKKIQCMDFLLIGVCVFLGLKSIRFWFYTYIVFSFILYSYVGDRKEDKGTSLILGILSIFFISLFFMRNSIFTEDYSYILNKEDINKIKEVSPKKLFNMYDYGGDLIYNDILVYIDGRADLYSPYYYSDYLEISSLKKKSISYIEKYQFDYFLVDSGYPINTYLYNNTEDYELIYTRDSIYLYKKKN